MFAKGDSMEPAILDNETVMVDTSERKLRDGHILVIRNGSLAGQADSDALE